MNEIQKYKEYHAIKIRTAMGYETLLLTDHDMKRCRLRACKHDLSIRKVPFLERLYCAILIVIYG